MRCRLLSPADALHIGEEAHVLQHRQVAGQRELLCDVAHTLPDGIGVGHRIVAQDLALTRRPPEQAEDHARGGGLAGAIGTDQTVGLTTADLQRHAIHGGHRRPRTCPEVLDQVPGPDRHAAVHQSSRRLKVTEAAPKITAP